MFQPASAGQWSVPDLHEPRLVREVKEHRQVERREKEGRRRERIQAGRVKREQMRGVTGEKTGRASNREGREGGTGDENCDKASSSSMAQVDE